MKNHKPETLSCHCGAELYPLYNPVTEPWIAPNPSCSRCLEAIEAMERKARKEAVRMLIRQEIKSLLKKAGVPSHFLNASLSNYLTSVETQSVLKPINCYLEEKKHTGRFLFGPTGVGKTHLAASLARVFLLQAEHVLFQNMHRLFLNIRSAFDATAHAQTEKEHLDFLRDASVLILDDLGAEQLTSWSRSIMSLIINDRYESSHRRLIITSNLNLKQIEQKYTPRVASRIMGMCKVLSVDGPDFRIRKT
ncbi:MAG: ATP-binding protein [Nitrospiria bacterium]